LKGFSASNRDSLQRLETRLFGGVPVMSKPTQVTDGAGNPQG
jgi:hypothetical protein